MSPLTLEETKQAFPATYQHLLKLSPDLIAQMKRKSIDVIILECGVAEGRLHLQNKKLVFEVRLIGQKEQDETIRKKLDNYERKVNLFATALSGCASVAGAFAGPTTAMGVGLSAIGGVIQTTGSHFDKKADGELAHHDHIYSIKGSIVGEQGQNMREADQAFDRILSVVTQFLQSQQKMIELVASNS